MKVSSKVQRGLILFTFLGAAVAGFQNCGNSASSASPNNLSNTGAATTTTTTTTANPLTLSAITATDETPITFGQGSISVSVTVTDAASTNYTAVWSLLDSNNQPVVDSQANNGITTNACVAQVCTATIVPPDITDVYTVSVQVTDDQNNTATATVATTPGSNGPGRICPAWGCGGPPKPINPINPIQPIQPIPQPTICPAWGCGGPHPIGPEPIWPQPIGPEPIGPRPIGPEPVRPITMPY